MARRQPSSVLSICMSRILDTSSVSTLWRGAGRGKHQHPNQTVPLPGPPRNTPEGLSAGLEGN